MPKPYKPNIQPHPNSTSLVERPWRLRHHRCSQPMSPSPLHPSTLTLVIEEYGGINQNQLYSAAEIYLSSRISPDIQLLRVSKSAKEDNLNLQFDRDERINDTFEGIVLKWCRYFELSFDQKHKERVLGSYLPYILEQSKAIRDAEKVVSMHTYVNAQGSSKNIWESVILRHPSTFEALTMDIEQKKAIIDDLDRVNLLKRERTKAAEIKDRDEGADQLREAKRQKLSIVRALPERKQRMHGIVLFRNISFWRPYPIGSDLTLSLPLNASSFLPLLNSLSSSTNFAVPLPTKFTRPPHIYLPTKISPSHDRIQVSKPSKQSNSTITLPKGAQVEDSFRNIRLQWKLVDDRKLFFELSFDKQFIEIVLESYLLYVIAMSK
ncbi:AAA-ATPase [Vitis vinifera]|uniref:AAA-ATPase n=1 Tax=Vitis vinifera TaxID=29760 RepID=A0A438EVC1_VITVI|nr:AAA-ATPase [Vitis vinifera]